MLMPGAKRYKTNNEDGFASLVVAIVIVLVLSLITTGFAQLMRREQRSALDKQLSSQAYYAAESGVNDALKAMQAGYNIAKTNCGTTPGTDVNTSISGNQYLLDNKVGINGANTGASYTCLLIRPDPLDLDYRPVDTFTPSNAEFVARDSSGNPSQVTSVEVSWQDALGNSTFLPSPSDCSGRSFASAGSLGWSYTGLLNFVLVPVPNNNISRAGISSASMTSYLCPNQGVANQAPGSLGYGANTTGSNNGAIISGNCNTSHAGHKYNCSAVINNLGTLTDQTTFFISVRSIYSRSNVNITAYNGSTKLTLTGAQTVIDSTGKAQDVLKRIQVRVPSGNTYDLPPGTAGALICKQVESYPAVASDPDGYFSNKCQAP